MFLAASLCSLWGGWAISTFGWAGATLATGQGLDHSNSNLFRKTPTFSGGPGHGVNTTRDPDIVGYGECSVGSWGGGVSTPGISKNRGLRVAARTGWGQDSGILFVSSALLDGSEARCESAPMPAGPSRGCSLAAVGAGSSSGILVALAGNRRWGGNSACVD